MLSCFEPWANTFDESTLFLEIIGNFFGIKHNGCVEVGKEDDKRKINAWVEEPLGSNSVWIKSCEI